MFTRCSVWSNTWQVLGKFNKLAFISSGLLRTYCVSGAHSFATIWIRLLPSLDIPDDDLFSSNASNCLVSLKSFQLFPKFSEFLRREALWRSRLRKVAKQNVFWIMFGKELGESLPNRSALNRLMNQKHLEAAGVIPVDVSLAVNHCSSSSSFQTKVDGDFVIKKCKKRVCHSMIYRP